MGKKWLCVGLLVLLLCGCSIKEKYDKVLIPEEKENTAVLQIEEETYNGGEYSQYLVNHYEYHDVEVGQKVYGGYGEVSVQSADSQHIVLKIDGNWIEPKEDGSISLLDKGLKSIDVPIGESVKIATQTMDAGATLTISYGY